jgi:sugar-specific transcriptional regulator TrmB
MDIYEKLQEAGLTGNEAKVYLELLRKGEMGANQVAKNLGMDRTLAYGVLNNLVEKGHVGYVVKDGKKKFSTSDPESLLNPLKAKEILISELVKELGKIGKKEQQDVEVNVFGGKEGMRKFLNMAMKYDDFCAFGSTGRAFDFLYELPAVAKECEKRKMKGRIITTPRYKNHGLMMRVKKFVDLISLEHGQKLGSHLISPNPINLEMTLSNIDLESLISHNIHS